MENIKDKGKGAVKEKFKLKHLFRKRLDVWLKYHKPLSGPSIDIDTIAQLFPVKDQGGSLSCGGQAWAGYAEVLKYIRDGNVIPLSAKDIYSHVFLPGGGSSEGDLIDWVENNGIAYESDVPSYQNGQVPTEDYMETISSRPDTALEQIVIQPLTFNGNDINQVNQAFNFGCVFALYGNDVCWTTANGVVEVPQSVSDCPWAHWLFGTKDLGTQKKVKNSWGIENGDKGYYYIPNSYFANGLVMGEWTFALAPKGYYVGLLEQIENLIKNIIEKLIK